jgi:hypothetical protein
MSVFNMMDTWPNQGNLPQFLTGPHGLTFNTGQPFEQQHASFGLVFYPVAGPSNQSAPCLDSFTGCQFVPVSDGSHSPATQTVNFEAYQTTLFFQTLGDVEAWHGHGHGHGGGGIAFLIFLAAVFVWNWRRRPRHR